VRSVGSINNSKVYVKYYDVPKDALLRPRFKRTQEKEQCHSRRVSKQVCSVGRTTTADEGAKYYSTAVEKNSDAVLEVLCSAID
jgi:hypothetical protein